MNDMTGYQYYAQYFREPMRELLYHDLQLPYDPMQAREMRDALLQRYPDILRDPSVLQDETDDNDLMLHLLTDDAFLKNPYHVPATAARNPEEKKYSLLLREYLHHLLSELNERFNRGDFYDVYHGEVQPTDFQGLLPVWVIWWQGEEDERMPEIVRMCMNSIRCAIPSEYARLHLITSQNYRDFVTLPPLIESLFAAGNITITHLSDILRAELLYRYGGLYIDATYLIRRPLPEEWFREGVFYMPRLKTPEPIFVSQGQWFGNFIKTDAGDILPRYLRNAFYLYWSQMEEQIDYFLIDIIIGEAKRYVKDITEKLEQLQPSMPHIEHLLFHLNDPYTREADEMFSEDTFLYKLSYKGSFHKRTESGEKTFYGVLHEQYYPL